MSVAAYWERLEAVSLDIQARREREPKYFITLWWGFDGLREGDGGVWAWVSRRAEPTGPVLWADNAPLFGNPLRYEFRQIALPLKATAPQLFPGGQGGPDATIARLQAELANVNCNIALSEQQKRLAEMVNQCCVNRLNRGFGNAD